jgi:hypothetical protein
MPNGDAVTSRLLSTTVSSDWRHVGGFDLAFPTDHPQGLLRVDEGWFLSTVRIPVGDPGAPDLTVPGDGYLIHVARDGEHAAEQRRLKLSDGMNYHPGGIASDGRHLFVPVSEYRPDSSAHIYKIDPVSMEVVDRIDFADHVGALSIDPARRRIYGMSWAARRIYVWDDEWNLIYVNNNLIDNVNYQDIDFVGGNTLACSGVAHFELNGMTMDIGGIDLVDANTWLPYHRIMVPTKTRTGRPLTFNAFSHHLDFPKLQLLFVPDDNEDSRVEIYEI